jgi:ribosomal-protein-alanine N-acetyltransferase
LGWDILTYANRVGWRGSKTSGLYAKIILTRKEIDMQLRPMKAEDIPQVTAIDREAFPTLWPPANYDHELKNGLAHYIVASDDGSSYVLGFAGIWLLADEAHITNIAVREKRRRRGIGERLLIAIIELAIELGAKLITLEVRASNTDAQKLYARYGFVRVGRRRGYYTDNREDAVLMSIEDAPAAKARLEQLKQAHAETMKLLGR